MRVEVPGVTRDARPIKAPGSMLFIEKHRLNKARIIHRQLITLLPFESPVMREGDVLTVRNQTEGMVKMVRFPGRRICLPVDKFNRPLEGGVATAHPFVLRYAQEIEEDRLQIGYGRLSDTDLGNGRRFDE